MVSLIIIVIHTPWHSQPFCCCNWHRGIEYVWDIELKNLNIQIFKLGAWLVPKRWNQTAVFGSKSIHWKKGRSTARVPKETFTPAWSIQEWYFLFPNLVYVTVDFGIQLGSELN